MSSISRIGSAKAEATSITTPVHAIGDIIVIAAFRDGSTTAPSLGAGYTNINTGGDTASSMRVGYKIATATNDASGTWTNATEIIAVVYRGQNATPIGDSDPFGGTGTTVTYGALTLVATDGSSWALGFGGHQSTNTTLETPPSGMALVIDQTGATAEEAAHDSNGQVTAWVQTNVSVGGTGAGWMCITVELRAAKPDLTVNVSDSSSLTESVGRTLESNVNVSDTAATSESTTVVEAGGATTVNVSDTVTTSENSVVAVQGVTLGVIVTEGIQQIGGVRIV